jgi:L,D-transpeptidase catalytic domain
VRKADLKRFSAFALIVFLVLPTLPIRADALLACSTLTVEQPHSDACIADITSNPAPSLERPVAFNPKKQGVSHPRSVLLPKDPLPYPIGWILRDWPYSDTPGIVPAKYTPDRLLRKATIVYVYATIMVKGVEWHLVGPDQWMSSDRIAVLRIPTRPEGVTGHWIALDLSEQTLLALDGDTPVFSTLISAAYNGYGFTRVGLYNIYARTHETVFRGPPWKEVPDYVINHVPDVMFFDRHIALHGAYWHDMFGIPLTHGCVNVPVGDEEWLWNWVSETADQWGPDKNQFFLPHRERAPFVYVYQSKKRADNQG